MAEHQMNIIELAKEAGLLAQAHDIDGHCEVVIAADLERFATLVRAEALEEAAKVCDEEIKSYMSKQYTTDPLGGYRERFAAEQCAAAIRSLIK